MQTEVILEARKINKFFYSPDKFKVLSDISLSINKGEFTTLVGKSGCGKSTLLYILSTMDTDYTGKLLIQGENVTGKKQDQLAGIRNEKIGFVFQSHYLLSDISCLQNVMIPALRLGQFSRREIEEKAYEKLSLLDLRKEALKPASKLSGGQQQRAAIARALINDPIIVMGDEPTGNLDSKNTDVVFEMLQQLAHDYKQTIIAVTHDNNFADKSDRIIEMSDGMILS